MTNQFTDSQLKLLSDHLEQIKNDDALYNQLIKLPDFKSHIEYLIHKINNIINQIDAQFRSGGGYYNSEVSYKNSNCFICNSLFDSILIYSNYLTEMLKINKYSVSKIIKSPFTIWNLVFIFKKHYLADNKFHSESLKLRTSGESMSSHKFYDLHLKKYIDKLNITFSKENEDKIVQALYNWYPDFTNLSTRMKLVHTTWIENCKRIFSMKCNDFLKWLKDLNLIK